MESQPEGTGEILPGLRDPEPLGGREGLPVRDVGQIRHRAAHLLQVHAGGVPLPFDMVPQSAATCSALGRPSERSRRCLTLNDMLHPPASGPQFPIPLTPFRR